MESLTAYQIWKRLHYTNPQDLDDDFNSQTKFIKLSDACDLCKLKERRDNL